MPPNPLEPGFRLGKYEVLAHIATGGMGMVYKARDPELRRTVALKVLPSHLAERGPDLERFRREARHAARLIHKHIVTLFECGHDPEHDLHYLAMEFVDGVNLLEHIERKGKLPPEEARRILVQAAKALEHAFEQGVIHRDIKPSNFLLARVGNRIVVKLTDLGLALTEDEDNYKVTREGNTVGTIDYMSPEQARDSRAADVRSDLYSLGCTAYHMLAGKAPFSDGGLGERVYKHMALTPPDVRQFNPAVSAGLWAVLLKMLAKRPEDRYATPTELLQDLQNTPGEASDGEVAVQTKPAAGRRKTDPIISLPPAAVPPPAPRVPSAPPPEEASKPPEAEPPPRKPRSTPPPAAAEAAPPTVTLEQARAAAAFHERAVQVHSEGGGHEYVRELLHNALRLDPFNPAYRKMLREINRTASGGVLRRWFGSLNVLATRSKLRAARSAGDWRKVLEYGEELLARQPADADAHLEMAEAAEKLGLPNLALWLLEQGHDQVPKNADILRRLALLHEQRKEWKRAIALWERVRHLEPDDHEAGRKINNLAAMAHISQGNYRR